MQTIFRQRHHATAMALLTVLSITGVTRATISPDWAYNNNQDNFVVKDGNLYQIKVANWGGSTINAEFIASRLLTLFGGSQAEFAENYASLLSGTLLQTFSSNFAKTKLSRPGIVDDSTLFPETRTENIVDLAYFNGQICHDSRQNPDKQKRWITEILPPALQKTEPTLSDPYAIPDAAVFASSITKDLYQQFAALSSSNSHTFAIKLGVFSGCELLTALLLTKQSGTTGFVWANPANNGTWDTNIRAAIDLVARFAGSLERVQNALIRYAYAYYSPQTKNVARCLEMLRDAIGATALKQNALFNTIYYNAFKTIADKEVYKKKIQQSLKEKAASLLAELKP